MRTIFRAILFALASLSSTAEFYITGSVEVDLVFPQNETYAPTELFPVGFAIQNPYRAIVSSLNLIINVEIWNYPALNRAVVVERYNLLNFSRSSGSDTHFEYRPYSEFNQPGVWQLIWSVNWTSCTDESLGKSVWEDDRLYLNSSAPKVIMFTIEDGAREVDLNVAEGDKRCDHDNAVVIDVEGAFTVSAWAGGDTCAVIGNGTAADPDPCGTHY